MHDGVNGFLVPKHDPAAIADRLIQLLENTELRNRMGQASRRLYGSDFTQESMVNRLGAAMRQVLSRPARAMQPDVHALPVPASGIADQASQDTQR